VVGWGRGATLSRLTSVYALLASIIYWLKACTPNFSKTPPKPKSWTTYWLLWCLAAQTVAARHLSSCWWLFSQPSIYIDGWLYGMSMTSVVCNVPVLSQNDSTYYHSVFTTWKWHPFATWTPSFIILVWGHHPLIGATVFLASRTLVKRRTVTP